MDLWSAIFTVIRRWYVALPILLVSIVAMVVIGGKMQPDYKAEASVVFTAPARKVVNGQEQPFKNQYANDTKTLAAAVYRQITNADQHRSLDEDGFSPRYDLVLDQFSAIMDIEVTATSQEQAIDTANQLISETDRNALAIQRQSRPPGGRAGPGGQDLPAGGRRARAGLQVPGDGHGAAAGSGGRGLRRVHGREPRHPAARASRPTPGARSATRTAMFATPTPGPQRCRPTGWRAGASAPTWPRRRTLRGGAGAPRSTTPADSRASAPGPDRGRADRRGRYPGRRRRVGRAAGRGPDGAAGQGRQRLDVEPAPDHQPRPHRPRRRVRHERSVHEVGPGPHRGAVVDRR